MKVLLFCLTIALSDLEHHILRLRSLSLDGNGLSSNGFPVEMAMGNVWFEGLGMLVAAGPQKVDIFILPYLIGVFLVIGGAIVLSRWSEKKREAQWKQIAEDLGLPFFPQGDGSLISHLHHFHLFSQGRSRKIRNMLHGETDEVELAIFDYRFRTGSGENKRIHRQTVIYFRSSDLKLPQFAVRPEHFFHKIGGAFGYQDIDFETHPEFSKTYLLRGDDESSVRQLFNDSLLKFFESQPKISVEAGGNQLIFYRQRKRTKPDEVRSFMQEGFQVFDQFRGSCQV